jgi:hypothetical protein
MSHRRCHAVRHSPRSPESGEWVFDLVRWVGLSGLEPLTFALSEGPGLFGSCVRAQDCRTWSVTKPRVVLHSFTLFVRLVSPARPLPFDYFLMIAAYAKSKAAVRWPASERY